MTVETKPASCAKAGCGVLVGWTAESLGQRLALRVQTVETPPPHAAGDVASLLMLMDRNQAVQLGNFLLEMAGVEAPQPRGGRLHRLFG